MRQELIDKINSQLEYGNNRSAWVRDAINMKFDVIELLGDKDNEMTDRERREFVREAVRNELEQRDD